MRATRSHYKTLGVRGTNQPATQNVEAARDGQRPTGRNCFHGTTGERLAGNARERNPGDEWGSFRGVNHATACHGKSKQTWAVAVAARGRAGNGGETNSRAIIRIGLGWAGWVNTPPHNNCGQQDRQIHGTLAMTCVTHMGNEAVRGSPAGGPLPAVLDCCQPAGQQASCSLASRDAVGGRGGRHDAEKGG